MTTRQLKGNFAPSNQDPVFTPIHAMNPLYSVKHSNHINRPESNGVLKNQEQFHQIQAGYFISFLVMMAHESDKWPERDRG
jgi:hypothetical protein